MGLISTGPGSPLAFGSASGGKVYGYNNISTTPRTVAPANTSRQKITFHNPGTVDLYIAPANVQNVLGTSPTQPANVALAPTTSALGGCWLVYANGGTLSIEGECQGAWQALAASGTTNPLTVMDSNV